MGVYKKSNIIIHRTTITTVEGEVPAEHDDSLLKDLGEERRTSFLPSADITSPLYCSSTLRFLVAVVAALLREVLA